ncbi:MAG: mismatch repair protein mutS [Bacteriovoracaceae bacterium]|nr:mismatch repair protein mutS [Bacteriovoracaceae bacterium]
MEVAGQTLTPMMRQWTELKNKAGSALLFFRLGDFYELFEEDAVKAAPVLQVVLTSRNNRGTNTNSSPLCGVPVASIDTYLTRALDHGFKIALAEQTEEPQAGRVIVRREIVQWFTPGIRLLRNEEKPHYAAVISGSPEAWSLAAADVGTGHVILETGTSLETLQDLVDRLPIEDLRSPELKIFDIRSKFSETCPLLSIDEAEEDIRKAFGLANFADTPTKTKLEAQVLGTLFQILRKAHPQDQLRFMRPRATPAHTWVSAATRKNLYLFEPADKSVFSFLDKTQTATGRRELKQVLSNPTRDPEVILSRQKLISYFKNNAPIRKLFRSRISGIHDLYRLLRKRRGALELYQVANALTLGLTSSLILKNEHSDIGAFQSRSDTLTPLAHEFERCLQVSEDSDVGWIKPRVSETLDELRGLKENSQKMLADLEERLRAETRVSGLKIKFHQVFGYVAEVTALHKDKIPTTAKRIQTLANAERFKTTELEQLEEKILSLDSRIHDAERAELDRLYTLTETHESILLDWTDHLGRLDCFQALAEISDLYGWTTPTTLAVGPTLLQIEKGIHPLSSQAFVPMSFELSAEKTQLMLLTGPNMAGKSTLLRLAALIALLHQIGSDVPAKSSRLSLFDRIVCRMGAQDDLNSGQSTFFVEMREVASMLHGASEKSLLLFDEIGRGTSTFDGMSLAWAITEEVHDLKALCFMATHYLELSDLEKSLEHLKSFHLGVEEIEGKLVFTRALTEGPASRSYGIQVAKLADISPQILNRANAKLLEFEKKRAKAVPLFEMMGSI